MCSDSVFTAADFLGENCRFPCLHLFPASPQKRNYPNKKEERTLLSSVLQSRRSPRGKTDADPYFKTLKKQHNKKQELPLGVPRIPSLATGGTLGSRRRRRVYPSLRQADFYSWAACQLFFTRPPRLQDAFQHHRWVILSRSSCFSL